MNTSTPTARRSSGPGHVKTEVWFNPATKRYEKVLVENEPEPDLTIPKI